MNNIKDMTKIKTMIEEAGFMPDGDLYEVSELMIKECCSFLEEHTNKILTIHAIKKLKQHFGL